MIALNKALEEMRRKDERGRFVPFSLTFVTCNRAKKTGGELITYNHVTLPQRERVELHTAQNQQKNEKKTGYRKTTVMLRTSGDEFREAHIHLIRKFNGEKVLV